MDEYAKSQIVSEEISKDKVLVTGQPYFDYFLESVNTISELQKAQFLENINYKDGEIIIVFASEPITKVYGKDNEYWGYNEITIGKLLMEKIKLISIKYKKQVKLVIRPHPKEDVCNWENMIKQYISPYLKIVIDKIDDSKVILKMSDLICGMSSMFLIEAAMCQQRIISVQIGLKRENPLILEKMGVLKSILQEKDLEIILEKAITSNLEVCRIGLKDNAVNNINCEIEKVINKKVINKKVINKKYKVLIIGAGNIGAQFDEPGDKKVLTHAHAYFSDSEFELLGFYDVDTSRSISSSEKWSCNYYEQLGDGLSDADIVCICVPDIYHFETIKKVIKYSPKVIICEKPIAKTVKEAYQINELCSADTTIIVNYSRRFIKDFMNLKEEIKEYGAFIKGTGYYGKGNIHNGTHMIDLLLFLLGDISEYSKISNVLYDFEKDDPSCDVDLKIGDATFGMRAISSNVATIFELDLFFEKARIRILDGGTRIEKYEVKESPTFKDYYNYILTKQYDVDYSQAMLGLKENVYNLLENGVQPVCSLNDAIRVLEISSDIRDCAIDILS